MYMNQLTIVGNVTRDAQVVTTNSGKEIVRFAIAVNRGKDQPTDFFEIAAFEKSWALDLAKKGALMLVQGSMRSNKSDDGVTYWAVWADKILLMNSREKKEESNKKSSNKKKDEDYYPII